MLRAKTTIFVPGRRIDAGELFAADHFLRPLLNLLVELGGDLLKTRRHLVQGRGQLGHFVS